MKPAAFEYHRPENLTEATEMLASLSDAKILAGGQSLGPMLNFRYLMPENLIDLNRVPELQGIAHTEGVIRIGAMTRQYQLEREKILHKKLPIFREALRWVGHYATRNRGTIGGSLSHLDPAAELPGLCALLDAELVIRKKGSESRTVSIHDWPVGFMQPNISEDELLTEIVIRPWSVPHGFSFLEMSRRHGDFAIAGVACLVSVDSQLKIQKAAVSLIGVANGATRLRGAEAALVGSAVTENLIETAGQEIDQLEAPADAHHSGAFRKRTAKTLFFRAVHNAYQDAVARRTA